MSSCSLGSLLRRDTADLHVAVEQLADLPASVRTRGDYARLLFAFQQAHAELEGAFDPARWAPERAALGIELAGHRQLHLVRGDLVTLGLPAPDQPVGPVPRAEPVVTASLDEQLGHLYVLEGSSLGRRMIAPGLVAVLGEIPVTFLLGAARHPRGWQAVQHALQALDAEPERHHGVLRGARVAFGVFARHLASRAEASLSWAS